MIDTASRLLEVREIVNAGRGVIASQHIRAGTVLLESDPPAFHVILKAYGKEACASCFHWDRGRTLSIRDHDVAKCFCSPACQAQWQQELGEDGRAAWRALIAFARAHGKGTNTDDVMGDGLRPERYDIDTAWTEAELQAVVLRRFRQSTHPTSKADQKHVNAIRRKLEEAVDIDTLSYLLSGALYYHKQPTKWHQEVLALAMDDRPYRTQQDLATGCCSYLQLISIIPYELLHAVTPELCRAMVQADNHNAFGIRAGEDNEEYMGYALYPSASYFNHSCDPNLNKHRIGRSWVFSAARDIEPGEECCITYLGGDEKDMSAAERHSRLKEVWDFDCACERCKRESCK